MMHREASGDYVFVVGIFFAASVYLSSFCCSALRHYSPEAACTLQEHKCSYSKCCYEKHVVSFWYLNEIVIGLALFDAEVSIDMKLHGSAGST